MTMRAWRTKKNALAKVTVAQAFLPAHLMWGGDDEQSISGLACALASATVPGIQPASHRGSPRIAADPCGSGPIVATLISGSASPGTRAVRRENPDFTLAQYGVSYGESAQNFPFFFRNRAAISRYFPVGTRIFPVNPG